MILIVVFLSVFLGLRNFVVWRKDHVRVCDERAMGDGRHPLRDLTCSCRAVLIALEVFLVTARGVRRQDITLVNIMISTTLPTLPLD